jgi:ATP-dependent DNA helicase Q1
MALISQIKSVEDQLAPLQSLHASLKAERRLLEAQLSHSSRLPAASSSGPLSTGRNADSGVDYLASSFPWSDAVKSALKTTFGLTSFRLCQEGVINAAMDGRDIVCVMPTGGGKSLTYQLPAIAGARGLTVVISPLLALIWDQVRALKELGVECAVCRTSI